jgi:hypothetical protein
MWLDEHADITQQQATMSPTSAGRNDLGEPQE